MSCRIALGVALLGGLLAGCGNNTEDLQSYIEQVKARPKGPIEPMPIIKPYETFAYTATNLRDPFTPPVVPGESKTQTAGGGLKPDANRPKEALEEFPLDALRLVGSLERSGGKWSIVKAPDGAIYRVQPGNYLGQNNGKITRISDELIELTEIVEDGQGGWMERQASLALSEESAGEQKK
ncbi:MAG: pilus assembly protein PilP [Gammaproteobacteria bacterium]|nr:pilus assembly protein PilP [Gammaproteobacteria bacterium]